MTVGTLATLRGVVISALEISEGERRSRPSPGDLARSAPAWPSHFPPPSEPIHSSLPGDLARRSRPVISPGDLGR